MKLEPQVLQGTGMEILLVILVSEFQVLCLAPKLWKPESDKERKIWVLLPKHRWSF